MLGTKLLDGFPFQIRQVYHNRGSHGQVLSSQLLRIGPGTKSSLRKDGGQWLIEVLVAQLLPGGTTLQKVFSNRFTDPQMDGQSLLTTRTHWSWHSRQSRND